MNTFKPTKAKSFQEYFDALGDERRKQAMFLHEFIQQSAPSLKLYLCIRGW